MQLPHLFVIITICCLQYVLSFSLITVRRHLCNIFQNEATLLPSTFMSMTAEDLHRQTLSTKRIDGNADDTDNDNDIMIENRSGSSSSKNKSNNLVEYSFYDEVTVLVRAGSGGQGASTYKKGIGGQNGPPDGGNGGNGGNVILIVDDSLNTLAGLSPYAYKANSFGGSGAAVKIKSSPSSSGFTQSQPRYKSFRAEIGYDGGRQLKRGRYGSDVTIRVPPGTIVHEVIENDYGGEELIELGTLLLKENDDSDNHGNYDGDDNDKDASSSLIVARGGEGGEGSGINQKGRGLQRPRSPPTGGEKFMLRLTLKLIADIALVGVPNAGKSTFLSKVTRAKPRIADYPFTTVIPNLGVWVPPELFNNEGESNSGDGTAGTGGKGLVLCDVPGLIEGASRGVGLGHAFLRHVERCHVILHLVDANSPDPIQDFQILNKELINYGTGQLARMPQVVVINKIDTFRSNNDSNNGKDNNENNNTSNGITSSSNRLSLEELEMGLKDAMSHSRLMTMSAKEEEGVDELMKRLAIFVQKVVHG